MQKFFFIASPLLLLLRGGRGYFRKKSNQFSKMKLQNRQFQCYPKFFLLLLSFLFFNSPPTFSELRSEDSEKTEALIKSKYERCKLKNKVKFAIFRKAYWGMEKLKLKKNIITIIDFDKPSTEKRFFVIDLTNEKLLFETYTAHGKNSGSVYAKYFSNESESYKSSLGFYKTGSTYQGEHNYSMRLVGLEKGINDKALERAIVIHGADYVSESFIKKHKRLGRSWGCPALPPSLSTKIIDKIKDGTCLFIHADDEEYTSQSKLLVK